MKKILLLFSLMIGFLFLTGFSTLRVYPLILKINGKAGENARAVFKLENTSQEFLSVMISKRDFYVDSNGVYFIGISTPTYKNSCYKWISLPSTSVTLFPKQQIDFPISVKIPPYANGEYFAGVNFSYMTKQKIANTFRISMNLYCIVILNIENSPHLYVARFNPIKLYNTRLDKLPKDFPSALKNYPYVFRLDYKNEGNVVIGLQGQFRVVSDTLHKLVGNVNLDRQKTICFPDITRTVWIPFERLMPNGEYRALLSADLGDHHMTSQIFKFKITDASLSQTPALKLNTSEIDIPLERLNTYLGENFKIESLDYRKIDISAKISGFMQTKDGSIAAAPLDEEVFGNLRMYPSKFSVYPYSQREARIAGRAPSTMPTDGQHYALLTLVAKVAKGKEPKILKLPIVINVGKLTKSLKMENLTVSKVGTSAKVSFDVVNDGNSYVDYSTEIFVTNEEGKSMLFQPVTIKEKRIYAGFTLSASANVPVELKKGYTVRVVVKYSTGKGANGAPIYKIVSKEFVWKG